MTEKSSNQHSAISTQESSFQPSALSCQPLMNSSFFAEDVLPEALYPEIANKLSLCRITCDETAEDFRLTLCRTLCAGACPRTQEFRESPRESVAAFLKADSR
jgi:hypothetical protein